MANINNIDIEITKDLTEKITKSNGAWKKKALNSISLKMKDNALTEVDKLVYNTPESPNYRRTNALRQAIAADFDDDSAVVGNAMEYAPYVEYGTKKGMPARPFIKNSLANYQDQYIDILLAELKDIFQ